MGVEPTETAARSPAGPPASRQPWQVLRVLLTDRTALAGALIVALLSGLAIFGPALAPHDPNAVDATRRLAPASGQFPLGTDHLGRDLLSRLLYGVRLSLGTAVAAASAVAVLGMTTGMIAGYTRGLADTLISRLIDITMAFPSLLLALAITGLLGSGLRNLMIAVIAVWWAGYARVVRGVTMSQREAQYVRAAKAIGASNPRILRRHVLPNIIAPMVILTTLDMGAILLAISALSFLGLGVQPPTAELGSMLSEARVYLRSAPRLMTYPGALIFLAVLGLNLLGDGLRDALDPHTRRPR